MIRNIMQLIDVLWAVLRRKYFWYRVVNYPNSDCVRFEFSRDEEKVVPLCERAFQKENLLERFIINVR